MSWYFGGMIPNRNYNIAKTKHDLAWMLLLFEVCFLLEHLEGGCLLFEASLVLMICCIMIQLEVFTEKSHKFTEKSKTNHPEIPHTFLSEFVSHFFKNLVLRFFSHFFSSFRIFSTASGALVVGGVRDIVCIHIPSGDRFECSREYNQSVSGSLW